MVYLSLVELNYFYPCLETTEYTHLSLPTHTYTYIISYSVDINKINKSPGKFHPNPHKTGNISLSINCSDYNNTTIFEVNPLQVYRTQILSSKSPFIIQMMADVLNRPVVVSSARQTVALGAAMLASVAAGIHPDVGAAASAMGRKEEVEVRPRETNVAYYQRRYELYKKYGAMQEEVLENRTTVEG